MLICIRLLLYYGEGHLDGDQSPTNHENSSVEKRYWMGPNIKSRVNPMPLTISFMAHKFNDLILNRNWILDPMAQSIRISKISFAHV